MPIEAKSGATFVTDWLQPLQRWTDLAGDAAGPPFVVFGGGDEARCKGIDAIPWRGIGRVLDTCAGASL